MLNIPIPQQSKADKKQTGRGSIRKLKVTTADAEVKWRVNTPVSPASKPLTQRRF